MRKIHNQRIRELQKLLTKYKIDGFLIPSSDEFMGEYVPEDAKRLEYITGFSGSNGLAIITKDKSAFFTDGRYILQASMQLDKDLFEVYDFAQLSPWQWHKNSNIKTIGFDPWLHTEDNIKKYANTNATENLVDLIWKDKPVKNNSIISLHPLEFSGVASSEKISNIISKLNADFLLLTQPDSICWLFNIRGEDVAFCPVILCYAFISKDGKAKIFHKYDVSCVPDIENVEFYPLCKMDEFIKQIRNKKIQLDRASCPNYFLSEFSDIETKPDPCSLPKSIKNETEINGAIEAHIIDGEAVIKFLYHLETSANMSEIEADEKILEFRSQSPSFKFPSFATIAGYGANGAIIHYRATQESNKMIENDNLFLLDSGGQYLPGTTDITRTIHLGAPSAIHKRFYTLVLKGHVNLAKAIFPIGTSGSQLDILARLPLWSNLEDFAHGTGHGVGSYLNVHEGPQRIAKYSSVPLELGMIVSNEPGFYKEGEFGIRIENLLVVEKYKDNFLKFRTLTQVPYEINLIEKELLSESEINWINDYHANILNIYAPKIKDERILIWLKNKCKRF